MPKACLSKDKALFRRTNKPNWSNQGNFPFIDKDIITRPLQVRHAAATRGAQVTNDSNRAVDSPGVLASSTSPRPGTKAISVVCGTELGGAKRSTAQQVRPIVRVAREILKRRANTRRCCRQSNLAGLNPFDKKTAHKSFRLKVTYSGPYYGITAINTHLSGSLNHHHRHHLDNHQKSLTHNDP